MTDQSVVLGVHGLGHDVNVAVLDSSATVVHVAEEERYSRKKGSTKEICSRWLFEVLDEVGVSPKQVTALAIAGIPGLMERRRLHGTQFGASQRRSGWEDEIAAHLPELREVSYVRHHVAHAASAAWCAPFDRSLVVTADGMGETDALTISSFEDHRLEVIERAEIPHSLGWVYRRLCNWAGITGAEREGKFMGLAAHGRPLCVEELRAHVMDIDEVGHPRLAAPLRAAAESGVEQIYLRELLGPGHTHASASGERHDMEEGRHPREIAAAADVAASAQVLLADIVVGLARTRCEQTSHTALAVAGGVFMNSVLNGELASSPHFDAFYAQPLAGDNGLGLGAAIASLSPKRADLLPDLYLGSDTGRPSVDDVRRRCPGLSVSVPKDLAGVLAEILDSGEPAAICRGRAEIGSRALGHRSVFGSATRPDTGEIINRVLKRREAWRPFAVVLLEEASERLFGRALSSPFMMEVHSLARPELVPAVAHVDGTSRPQTIARQSGDPFLVELLDRTAAVSGVPALLNTSLNRNGEPIVRTWVDALDLLLDSGLKVLILDDMLITKSP